MSDNKPNFTPLLLLLLALFGSSAFAANATEFIPQDEWYGLLRGILSGIPGAVVSALHDQSKRRKPNAAKHALAGFAAWALVALERDYLGWNLTLNLDFAIGGAAGFIGAEAVFEKFWEKWGGKA